jgi:hypothetical protein
MSHQYHTHEKKEKKARRKLIVAPLCTPVHYQKELIETVVTQIFKVI